MPERIAGHSTGRSEPAPRPPTLPADDGPVLSEGVRRALSTAAEALRTRSLDAVPHRGVESAALRMQAGALQQAVCDCVAELMARGEPPERVLRAVKRAALAAGVPERVGGAGGTLMDRIVRWCIEAYYRDT